MATENKTEVRAPRALSTAAPILRNDAKRIISSMRMVPMDQVKTPIPGQAYTGLDGKPSVAVPLPKVVAPQASPDVTPVAAPQATPAK